MSDATATQTPHPAPTDDYRAYFAGTGHGWMVARYLIGLPAYRVGGPYTTREQAEARAEELNREATAAS